MLTTLKEQIKNFADELAQKEYSKENLEKEKLYI